MPSFLDALKSAPQSSRAKINLFLTSFNPNARKIYIFLEGRDDPSFIRVHVSRVAGEANLAITTTVLGRKKDVLDAWKYLETRFPRNPRLMFFVDKDHDDLVGKTEGTKTQQSLFVTSYYSIENFLVSEDAVAVVLTDIWGLDSSSGAIEVACQNFNKFQQAYRNIFLPWMAWIVATRRLGEKPQNENIGFSTLSVAVNYELVLNWNPDVSTHLARECKVDNPPDAAAITLAKNELETLPTKVWLRGKQELWCLLIFLSQLEQEIKDDGSLKRIKIRSQINLGNAVEILAPRLACPKELNEYLKARLKALWANSLSTS